MAENKVNRENYIVIQGFMLRDLKLKGNELIIYACIYGFSQAENQRFTGSLQYLADWTNSTKQGVIKSLKSLCEKGLIVKTDKVINGVKFCEYHTTKFNGVCNSVEWGMQQSLMGGMQQSLPNNIVIDNKEDIINIKKSADVLQNTNTTKKKKSKQQDYSIFEEYAIDNEELLKALMDFANMRKSIKSPLTERAMKLLLTELNKLSEDRNTQIAIINQSILNNWKGVFPLKNNRPEVKKSYNYEYGQKGVDFL